MAHQNTQQHKLSALLDYQIGFNVLFEKMDEAISAYTAGSVEYFSFSFPIQKIDTLAVIEQHPHKDTFEFYWEKPDEEFSICAAGELARVQATGSNRFKEASDAGKKIIKKIFHFSSLDHSKSTPHLFGGFSFFDHNVGKTWSDYGAASFTLPQWSVIKNGALTLLTISVKLYSEINANQLHNQISGIFSELDILFSAEDYRPESEFKNNHSIPVPDKDSAEYFKWQHAIQKANQQIAVNDFDKIVLARKLEIETKNPVSNTYILNRLRHQYPECYSFLIRQNERSSFIGSTPERLAAFNNQFILTEGLAGSTPRGKTASEDAKLEHELLHSSKNRNEHEFVTNAIIDSLNEYSDKVEVAKIPTVKKLTNVQHLFTPIRAKIKDGVSKTELMKKLHPTPAVGGFPRDKAVPSIQNFEDFERGWYAAPIGWINANGDGEFAVAIRSGLIENDKVSFFAGCGIVDGSDPEKEWEETNLKFIPMLSALEYARK